MSGSRGSGGMLCAVEGVMSRGECIRYKRTHELVSHQQNKKIGETYKTFCLSLKRGKILKRVDEDDLNNMFIE